MIYKDSLEFIHSRNFLGSNLGLERIKKLLSELGSPHIGLNYVHVAGTNGKGSTCKMISEILIDANYKTGLFTSPYVENIRESIQINGKMISEADFASLAERLEPVVKRLDAKGIMTTEFEILTAMAFLHFKCENCSIVVLEVGMGGISDSTNVISTPLVSVITSISVDHTAVLGESISEIAEKKCGIIKHGGRTVAYPMMNVEALAVVMRMVAEQNNTLYMGNPLSINITSESIFGSEFEYDKMKLFISLSGKYQVFNAVNAIEAVRVLRTTGLSISNDNIANGISNSSLAARMEIISKSPLVLLDGGHNIDAATELYDNISRNVNGKISAVISMMHDKSYESYIKKLVPLFSRVTVTKSLNPRAADIETLASCAERYCQSVSKCSSPILAVQKAASELKSDETLLVCGSLYLAGDVRNELLRLFGKNLK